jgi:hypothetical protein
MYGKGKMRTIEIILRMGEGMKESDGGGEFN